MDRPDLKRRLRRDMQAAQAAANTPETSREQLLAVSEYARRIGGDIPGNGDLAEVARRSANLSLRGVPHPADQHARAYLDLDA